MLPLDLDAVVESATSLDPLPVSLSRLAGLVADDRGDMREIVEVVSFDQALTGAVLSRANSAASGLRNPIRTVHEAVVRLGTGTVLALAMSAELAPRLSSPIPEYDLGEAELWSHSVMTSLSVDVLRRHTTVNVPPEASTAALLHDLGKLVLARYLGPQVLPVLQRAEAEGGLQRIEAENDVLGVNHAELGALVVQSWGLPPSIAAGIQYHHEPGLLDLPIGYGVHLANLLAHDAAGTRSVDPAERDASMAALGMPLERWVVSLDTVQVRYSELASRYH